MRGDSCACVPTLPFLSYISLARTGTLLTVVRRGTGGDFSTHSLAFATDGEALVLSSSLSGTSSSTGSNGASGAEGTFCVAYPVYEGDEVHVPGGGGADDSLGAGGRTWTEDEADDDAAYL